MAVLLEPLFRSVSPSEPYQLPSLIPCVVATERTLVVLDRSVKLKSDTEILL